MLILRCRDQDNSSLISVSWSDELHVRFSWDYSRPFSAFSQPAPCISASCGGTLRRTPNRYYKPRERSEFLGLSRYESEPTGGKSLQLLGAFSDARRGSQIRKDQRAYCAIPNIGTGAPLPLYSGFWDSLFACFRRVGRRESSPTPAIGTQCSSARRRGLENTYRQSCSDSNEGIRSMGRACASSCRSSIGSIGT